MFASDYVSELVCIVLYFSAILPFLVAISEHNWILNWSVQKLWSNLRFVYIHHTKVQGFEFICILCFFSPWKAVTGFPPAHLMFTFSHPVSITSESYFQHLIFYSVWCSSSLFPKELKRKFHNLFTSYGLTDCLVATAFLLFYVTHQWDRIQTSKIEESSMWSCNYLDFICTH
jgi:hypothetical protein